MTVNWLESEKIEYDKLILTNSKNSLEKAKICLENDISIMIDDSVRILTEAYNRGIISLLMKIYLLDQIYKLCKEDELSIKLWYDFNSNQIVFNVWQGLDRVDTQNENTWAIFSRNFENILDDEYSIDSTKYRNFAYVKGEFEIKSPPDEDGNVTITKKIIEQTVDRVQEGEERREIYVDARTSTRRRWNITE